MMNTLLLTTKEQAVFDQLSLEQREGWSTNAAHIGYEDSLERTRLRLSSLHVTPALQEFQKKAQSFESISDLVSLCEDLDLSSMQDNDLQEVLFALGPTVMSGMIISLLSHNPSDSDIEMVAALSTMRQILFAKSFPLK